MKAEKAAQQSKAVPAPIQPFEQKRLSDMKQRTAQGKLPESSYEKKYAPRPAQTNTSGDDWSAPPPQSLTSAQNAQPPQGQASAQNAQPPQSQASAQNAQPPQSQASSQRTQPHQTTLTEFFREEDGYGVGFIEQAKRENIRIIGQLFDTYWLTQAEDKLFIIDQHAAHEKVLYERMMKRFADRELTSQQLSPPIVLSLNLQEQVILETHTEFLKGLGFAIESFGGREYVLSAVPDNLYELDAKAYFYELLDGIAESPSGKAEPSALLARIATAACKAAIKGNQSISRGEVEALIKELLTLENPYHCPHGRPTMISMSKREIEKKFKRII